MKFLVVLAVAVACAAADVSHLGLSADATVPIVKSDYAISSDGNSFQYAYETGNGISAQAEGAVKNVNSDEPALEVRGTYKYTDPEGTPVEITYVANEGGYQAQGSHIPVGPPIPEAILRSLAYIEANKPYVDPTKPAYGEPFKPVYKP